MLATSTLYNKVLTYLLTYLVTYLYLQNFLEIYKQETEIGMSEKVPCRETLETKKGVRTLFIHVKCLDLSRFFCGSCATRFSG